MRELLIGDLHFGIKNNSISWLDLQIKFFDNQIFDILETKNIDRCVILGDLTDIRYSINQQVGIELKRIIKKMITKFPNIDFYIVAGNHDYYSPLEEFSEYNSYELLFGEEFLEKYENLKIINDTPYSTPDGALFLPWYYTDNTKHIDEILHSYDFNDEIKVVYCHTDLSVWPGARINAFKGCPIYSGHIHYTYIDDVCNLFNIGSACSFTYSDINMDKYVYILEDYKIVEKIKNITTPTFTRLYDEEIFDDMNNNKYNNLSYVQLCISEKNVNNLKYIERIKEIKHTYITCNISVHILNNNDYELEHNNNYETFDNNIIGYITTNIPKHLNNKFDYIKKKIGN